MGTAHSRSGEFRKVGENLYRYSSNGVYYVRFRNCGKEISRSLQTTDRELAKRRLQQEMDKASRVNLQVSKLTLTELLKVYERVFRKFLQQVQVKWAGSIQVGCLEWGFELEFEHEFHFASRRHQPSA